MHIVGAVFSDESYKNNISAWIERLGTEKAHDMSRHVRRQHSTFMWAMDGYSYGQG